MTDRRQWYKIRNTAPTDAGVPEVLIYDEIDSWFGVAAADLVRDLAEIDAPEILVRINSPGGDMFDGIAIMNALRGHSARVTVQVDGLAASAASVIAMGGDEIVMNDGSQMMLHNAATVCIGNAADMAKMADTLDRQNQVIAGIYTGRAGGTSVDWLAVMADETWLNANESVQAGLADRVMQPPAGVAAEAQRIAASFDRSRFRYSGREAAPAPKIAARLSAAKGRDAMPASTPRFSRQDDEAVVDAAIREDKIVAQERDIWLSRVKQDPTGYRALLKDFGSYPGLNSATHTVTPTQQSPGVDPEVERISALVMGRARQPTPGTWADLRSGELSAPEPQRGPQPHDGITRVSDADLNAYIEADPEYHRAVHAISGGIGGLKPPEPQTYVFPEYDNPWNPKPKLVVNADGTGYWENQQPDPKWLGTQGSDCGKPTRVEAPEGWSTGQWS